jgi:predicted DNA-binding transcriptional regulator AlpA
MNISQRRNTAEAADFLGLARRTLEKYRIHGGGPAFYKLGRRVVYDTRDLDTWLQERRRRSTADVGEAA